MSPPASRRWRRLLSRLDRAPEAPYLVVIAATLLATWLAVSREAAALSVWNHLFYVPIVLAGLRLGLLAGAGTGLVAGLLAGPLSGHLIASVWLPRAGAFVLIGGVVGLVSSARSEAWRREREVAERESALVAQRASLVQLVSHEFRTPLTIIRGSLETLAGRKDAIAPAFRELVVATERSVDRLQEMVDVVLAAADELDTGSAPRTRVEVRDLVVHAARSLDDELPDRMALDVPEHSAVVTVEPYLWLTMRCLLDNARKFSPPDAAVEVRSALRGDRLEIAVTDAGPGLPPGFEEAAFEPFTQADPSERRSHQGLGVGLYTARRLARRLGGDVTVRAAAGGRGTTATIVVPAGEERDDWRATGTGTARVDRPA